MDMLAKLVLDRDFGVQEKAHGHRNWQWILEGSGTTRGSNSRWSEKTGYPKSPDGNARQECGDSYDTRIDVSNLEY